jgi:predicted nucleic acid-binding Zn ribbon protein
VICIESSPEGDDYNLAYYELINLLNEIPIDNIKKCSVCGRIFYHDRKGGLYCSERCRWKLSSKKYREKNPEAYKESQRRIMQEKYDKAIEKKHGSGKLRKLQKNRKEKGKNIVG